MGKKKEKDYGHLKKWNAHHDCFKTGMHKGGHSFFETPICFSHSVSMLANTLPKNEQGFMCTLHITHYPKS
jgi:hypothetical protein